MLGTSQYPTITPITITPKPLYLIYMFPKTPEIAFQRLPAHTVVHHPCLRLPFPTIYTPLGAISLTTAILESRFPPSLDLDIRIVPSQKKACLVRRGPPASNQQPHLTSCDLLPGPLSRGNAHPRQLPKRKQHTVQDGIQQTRE